METNFENYYKEDFKKKLENKYPAFTYRDIHWHLFQEVLDELGYSSLKDLDSNGWQHDIWFRIWKPGNDHFYNVTCSWNYPETTFELDNDLEILKHLQSNEI